MTLKNLFFLLALCNIITSAQPLQMPPSQSLKTDLVNDITIEPTIEQEALQTRNADVWIQAGTWAALVIATTALIHYGLPAPFDDSLATIKSMPILNSHDATLELHVGIAGMLSM